MRSLSAESTATETTVTSARSRIEINEQVNLLIEGEWITVILEEQPVMGYRKADYQTRNSVVVQLLNAQLITPKEAMQAFSIPSSSLYKILKNFNQEGIRGLIPKKSGPKQAWKLIPRARRLLLDVVYAHPDWKMPQIMGEVNFKLQQEQLAPLSERHASRFLAFCGILPTGGRSCPPRGPQLPVEIDSESQASICITSAAQDANALTNLKSNSSQIGPSDEKPHASMSSLSGCLLPQSDQPKRHLSVTERRYLLSLQSGIDSTFGGGFLVLPFLTKVQFPQLIDSELASLPQGYYSTLQLTLNFFYLALFGIASLEMVKRIPKQELGLLIGRKRSAGLTKLRAFLSQVGQLKEQTSAFALTAACYQIRAGVVDWQVLFVDGHFIPYYGQRVIRKGYFTTRRMAIKGNQAYYANDSGGRPLFFLLVSANKSLIQVLPQIMPRVRQLVGDQWTDWSLTLVFDRGGFCAELFNQLNQQKVYWVTWLKSSRKIKIKVDKIKEEKFRLYLLRLKKSKVKVKLYEWQVEITNYGSCRAIVLLDPKSGKRMVMITNDKVRKADQIAEYLLNRWSQENFFKLMLARYYLDYTPGYQFENPTEEPLVSNPRIKELRRVKKRLITMKRKLESELSKKLLARKRDKVSLQNYKKAHKKRIRTIEGLDIQIERIKNELAQTPKELPLDEVWEKKHEVANLERKVFFDCIKCLAFNAEEWLLEQFAHHYQSKNIRQVLLQIIFRGAHVQLVDGQLYVRLKSFDSLKVQAAAEALCLELNKKQIYTLDKFHFPVIYEVMPRL